MIAQYSLRWRLVGVRETGIRWGREISIEYGIDGSRTIWEGDFHEALYDVSFSIATPIYEVSGWFDITFTTQTRFRRDAYPLDKLIQAARDIIKNATSKCAELLGENALAKFDKLKERFEYDPSNFYVPKKSAARTYESGNVYVNPNHYVFNPDFRNIPPMPSGKKERKDWEQVYEGPLFWQGEIKKAGVSEYAYAVGAILHEFLHQTGKFKPHSQGTRESVNDQLEVIKKCIKDNEPKQ